MSTQEVYVRNLIQMELDCIRGNKNGLCLVRKNSLKFSFSLGKRESK